MDIDKKAELVHQQVVDVWGHYLKFYTAFLAVNFVALGIVTKLVDNPSAAWVVAAAFMAQNASTAVTALVMMKYTQRVRSKLVDMGCEELSLFVRIGTWGAIGNAVGHVIKIALWLVLAFVIQADAEHRQLHTPITAVSKISCCTCLIDDPAPLSAALFRCQHPMTNCRRA